ncbi:MAG TPA: DUF4091 domain-containing protein [Planctomycetota bacterium]|jgi:hypothetical protein
MLTRAACLFVLCGLASAANLAPDFKDWQAPKDEHAFRSEKDGKTVLGVRGEGKGSVAWRSPELKLTPSATYALRFQVSGKGHGTIISGLDGVNRDFGVPGETATLGFSFRVPDGVAPAGKEVAPASVPAVLHLGHWELNGEAAFDKAELYPVQAIHRRWTEWIPNDGRWTGRIVVLGEGEKIDGGVYTDLHLLNWQGSTIHRTLFKQNAGFNSNRWCFGPGAEVIYKHDLPGAMKSGELRANVSYHTGGTLVVSASKDGQTWTKLAEATKVGSVEVKLPPELFPANEIYIRMQAEGEKANCQVDNYSFKAETDGHLTCAGGTALVELRQVSGTWEVESSNCPCLPCSDFKMPRFSSPDELSFSFRCPGKAERKLNLSVSIDGLACEKIDTVQVPANSTGWFTLRDYDMFLFRRYGVRLVGYDKPSKEEEQYLDHSQISHRINLPAGAHSIGITARDENGVACELALQVRRTVLSESTYGSITSEDAGGVVTWSCETAWKPGTHRTAPRTSTKAGMQIEAARGEYEGVQLVFSPPNADQVLEKIDVGDLKHDDYRIPASNISLYEVAYVKVENPTDYLGEPGEYPDPLPPLVTPLKLKAGRNQPIYILVHVPDDAPAGDYKTKIKIKTDKGDGDVPLTLHVWDFALPKETQLRSGFGLTVNEIKRYHQLKTKEQEKEVYEKYLRNFAEHRIAPYSFYDFAPIQIKFDGKGAERKVALDWSAFDIEAKKYLSSGMFNGFQLNMHGMGGGTFFERAAGEFGGFKAGTADYDRLFGDYAKQLESHLRENGWLKQAYIYWFDEPDKKDYDFVIEGMDRIKKHAPGLRRLLTKHPDGNLPGHVDIWCGLTPEWTQKTVAERKAAGDEVWWYICCGPKAPYIGEFIEHPGVEMRLWPWQSWQYGVQGILVWSTNYWTSGTAFPKSLQDPWQDPQSYVSGYGTPVGAKQFWGNGDGRYLYPPRRDPNAPGEPVLDGPVSSLRWENLRDGVEDYEYFVLLQKQIEKARGKADEKLLQEAQALLTIPENISKDTTHFTTDVRPLLEHRRKIAKMIEQLQRK